MGNYFGDGSDGNVTISVDTDLTSTQDGDYIIKEYNNLTINVTKTLSAQNRCKGMFIYVKEDCTINGTLSMTDRGASGNPVTAGVSSTGIRLPLLKAGHFKTLSAADFAGCGSGVISAVANQPAISGDGLIYRVRREGGVGPAGRSTTGTGATGGIIDSGTGGGGAGGRRYDGASSTGDGGNGTCFSGGAGGGGAQGGETGGDGSDTGGAGGTGGATHSGGGAGNPGGVATVNGEDGTGGIIWLIVGGDLTIGASGVIEAEGDHGGGENSGGAGSGGGAIKIAYAGALSNSGTISVDGGLGGATAYYPGGPGGAGDIEINLVDGVPTYTRNYFGDGSDGDVTISSDTDLTSTQDGDYIVKQYSSLTIDAAKTLSVSNRCKGLFIYVKRDCEINGSLSMTKKGASATPSTEGVEPSGIMLPMLTENPEDMIVYQVGGVDYGYKSGNLVFIKNQWNGGANNGEVDMTGDTLVDWNGASRTVGDLNYGVALQERADTFLQKQGFIMYSTASVHTRFTGMNTDNADHFVGVYYTGSTWYYDNNTVFTAFTPVSTDLLVADLVWNDLSVVRFVRDCEGLGDTLIKAVFAGCGDDVIDATKYQGKIDGDGVILSIAREGAIGSIYTRDNSNGLKGAQIYRSGGGGGSGSEQYARDNHAGSGGRATCFSGGAGGGGKNDTAGNGQDGFDNGGPGGAGSGKYAAAGGAGNPGGVGAVGGGTGEAGTGGVIWLIVGGDLTIGGSATIEAIGATGGEQASGAGGGASGGGVIIIAHGGALSNSGTIDVSGGIGGNSTRDGGDGGEGYYHLVQVASGGGGPLPVMLGAFC